MTAPIQESQAQEQKISNKEMNFRALEAKYQQQLDQERAARLEAEKRAQELSSRQQVDEEVSTDPYVDHAKLEKKLNKFGQNTQTEIQKAMEIAKHAAKEELKQEMWLEQNPDFQSVMEQADKLMEKAPKLAETILRMPNTFDRQKLVYQNIKELGLLNPEKKPSSVQEKIDANRKSPYYQPSGVGTAPYAGGGDFSSGGQKNAYDQMQKLKSQLRL